jgi:hypothetical protein
MQQAIALERGSIIIKKSPWARLVKSASLVNTQFQHMERANLDQVSQEIVKLLK